MEKAIWLPVVLALGAGCAMAVQPAANGMRLFGVGCLLMGVYLVLRN